MDFKQMWNNYKNQPVQVGEPADLEANKIFAILSYFGILFFLPLVCCKDSVFGKFHSNQGLISFIFAIISLTALNMVKGFLHFIPFFGFIVSYLLGIGIGALNIALLVIGILNVVHGEFRRLPIIGKFDIIK